MAYTGRDAGAPSWAFRLSPRWFWVGLSLALLSLFAVAGWLEPSGAGHGTHTQLGLPPCAFLLLTGLPCPGCGLTTSFAWMARGQLGAALHAQPLGVLLFALCVAALPVCGVACMRGWSIQATLSRLHGQRLALGISVVALVTWCARLVAIWLA